MYILTYSVHCNTYILGLSFNLFFVVFCTLQKRRGKDQLHILAHTLYHSLVLSC
jgi:hypothetical protein